MSWYWRLFADDDPSAPAKLDPQIPRIGVVYDLSAVPPAIKDRGSASSPRITCSKHLTSNIDERFVSSGPIGPQIPLARSTGCRAVRTIFVCGYIGGAIAKMSGAPSDTPKRPLACASVIRAVAARLPMRGAPKSPPWIHDRRGSQSSILPDWQRHLG
jgi:hypothetical protein